MKVHQTTCYRDLFLETVCVSEWEIDWEDRRKPSSRGQSFKLGMKALLPLPVAGLGLHLAAQFGLLLGLASLVTVW